MAKKDRISKPKRSAQLPKKDYLYLLVNFEITAKRRLLFEADHSI
jgi:hypothetical protein